MPRAAPEPSNRPTKYEAIANDLAHAIVNGQYAPGEKLPPHRVMAKRLGVTAGTVSRAYASLERRALALARVGDGTYVRNLDRAQAGAARADAPTLIDLARNILLANLSKVMAPGLRVGYLEACAPWLDKVAASIRADCWMVAPLMPEIITRWLESGVADQLVARQRMAIHERLQLAVRCLRGLEFRSTPDLPHLYLPVPEPWTVAAFTARLRQVGVLVRTMDHFSAGRGEPAAAVRVSLNATPSLGALRQGLQALASVLHEGMDSTGSDGPGG